MDGAEGLPFPGLITREGSCQQDSKAGECGRNTFVILLSRLVDDRAVLQAAQIKHAHTTISAAANKDVDAVRTESNVIYLLVVRNQLCFGCERRNVPNCACCVDTRGDDQAGRDRIPIERGDRGSMFGRL